jgi:hypothetical protein
MSAEDNSSLLDQLSHAHAIEIRFMPNAGKGEEKRQRREALFFNSAPGMEQLVQIITEHVDLIGEVQTVSAVPTCYLVLYADYLGTKTFGRPIVVNVEKDKPLLDRLLKAWAGESAR